MKQAAARLYKKRPSEHELAGLGLVFADVAEQFTVDVWPDNMPSVNVFAAMATQWRIGPGGPVGLDYAALGEVWRRTKVKDRDDVFHDLRVMEDAALKEMRGN